MKKEALTRGGAGYLSTIYERLRKRSWRENATWKRTCYAHTWYLRGVRDALQAVDESYLF